MNFLQLIRKLVPTRPMRRWMDLRQEPAAIAHTMDVDRIHAALREAEAGNLETYFSLCRDVISSHAHAQAEFGKRKLAVVGDEMRVEAASQAPEDVLLADAVEAQLEALDGWLDALLHLLDSTLYPVAVLEKIYRPSDRPGWHYELADLRPVPPRLLDWSSGTLRIWDTDDSGAKLGTTHAPEKIRYIVHRGHALGQATIPDTWGGPMRAVIFWWFFATSDRHWWARFLDRFGAPFMVAKYDEVDDGARFVLQQAFQTATKVFGLAVPRHVEIEMQQATTQGAGEAFENFHNVCNQELSKVIIGQTLSATGQNLGLGGGQAGVQEGVRQDIRQFDAIRLAHTLRTQLLEPLRELNGWAGRMPNLAWGADSPAELSAIASILPGLGASGLEFTDEGVDELSQRLGLGLRRIEAAPAPGMGPLSAVPLAAPDAVLARERRSDRARRATDALAAAAAPDLAVALGADMKEIAGILDASTDLADFERRLRERFRALDVSSTAGIVQSVLSANSANAIINQRIPSP